MFCPEGYMLFSALRENCDHHASMVWSREQHRSPKKITIGKTRVRAKEILAQRGFFMTWMLSRFLNSEQNIYLCSPTGNMVIAGQELLLHQDILHWYEWSWPVYNNDELRGPFARHLTGERLSYAYNRFRFIDFVTGVISVKKRLQDIREIAESVDEDEDMETQIDVALNFDGWAICLKEDECPKTDDEFFERISYFGERFIFPNPQDDKPMPTRKFGGRPRKIDTAIIAYNNAFENGHGDLTWKEVAEFLRTDFNLSIHHETLARAVNSRQNKKANNDKTD